MNLKPILEGILFLMGDEGISFEQINKILETSDSELNQAITDLISDYENDDRGIRLEQFGEIYKLVTKKEHKDYYQKLYENEINSPLSQSVLETLAIVAYSGPIVRSQIDEIRGVDASYSLRKLINRNLIEEKGKSELPGRPNLYGITDYFFDYFGIKSIDELPTIVATEAISDDTNLFESKYVDSQNKNP